MSEARNIDWELSEPQAAFFDDDTPAVGYFGGWGCGKTWIGARKVPLLAIQFPEAPGLISANTHKQLHQSTLVEFWRALTEDYGLEEVRDYVYNKRPPAAWNVKSIFKEHEGVITFVWGAQIVTRSLDNYEPIRGMTLGWAWIDEAGDAKADAIRTVLSRLRHPAMPRTRFFLTGTPNGFDYLWEFFEDQPAKHPEIRERRRFHVASTFDNKQNLPDGYINDLLAGLDEAAAKQFVFGQFVDLNTTSAYAFRRDLNVTESAKLVKGVRIDLCCDFNRSPMSWLVTQTVPGQRLMRAGLKDAEGHKITLQDNVVLVVDEIVLNTSNTQEAIQEFVTRGYGRPATPGGERANVRVYGDASGKGGTGVSDYAIISQAGFPSIDVPGANPWQPDRVNAVNAKLRNAKGAVGVLIHPQCQELIKDLLQMGYKPGSQVLDKRDKKRSHTSDALGYRIHREWPVSALRTLKYHNPNY